MSSITGRLLDLWLPPDGAGRALGCLATTFTFDAEFFEQQCVGRFLGLDTRPGEAALIQAMRRQARADYAAGRTARLEDLD